MELWSLQQPNALPVPVWPTRKGVRELKILVRENEEPLGLRKAVRKSLHSCMQPDTAMPVFGFCSRQGQGLALSTVQKDMVVPICSGIHFVRNSIQLSFNGVWAFTCCHLGIRV
ncbi:hypothetical protein AVEN_168079-1 [Araneus ventricosus]|uniref:Uncharacterized protein n=1 Tax=Araneus ventricosus TaxID=182803 RepID=A0A4Y2SA97_ARAVE|nr:hypothetical protein AVEN_168079-1 [Araneus ventricosus]